MFIQLYNGTERAPLVKQLYKAHGYSYVDLLDGVPQARSWDAVRSAKGRIICLQPTIGTD